LNLEEQLSTNQRRPTNRSDYWRYLDTIERRRISVFPALMPEEVIWGYVARARTLNRAKRLDANRQMSGRLHRISAASLPPRLPELVAAVPEIFSSVDVLIEKHTAFPMLRWYLGADKTDTALATLRKGRLVPAGLQVGEYNAYPRHCPQCADEDVREYGFSYWRRVNVLPWVARCAIHDEWLLSGCGACTIKDVDQSDSPFPHLACVCGRPQGMVHPRLGNRFEAIASDLAKLASEMLTTMPGPAVPGQGSKALDASMRERARLVGMPPHISLLFRELQGEGTTEFLDILGVRATSIATYQSDLRGRALGIAARTVLIRKLYGSAADFSAACDNPIADPESKASTVRKPSDHRIQRTREFILEQIRANPGITGKVLRGRFKHQVDLLSRWDRQWLEAQVEMPDKLIDRTDAIERRRRTADEAEVAKIRARVQALVSAEGPPVKLTAGSLQRTWRAGGPLVESELAKHVETTLQHRFRCVLWALANRNSFASSEHLRSYLYNRVAGPGQQARVVKLLGLAREATMEDLQGPISS